MTARRLVNAEHESTHTRVITRYAAQRALMLAAIVALAACGDSSGPDTYPNMLGTYDLTLDLHARYAPVLVGPGTIHITGQQDSTLTGDATVVLAGGFGPDIVLTGFGVAAVQKNGSIRFNIAPASPDEWTFSGRVKGNTMSGSHTLWAMSGSWTARRR